MANFLPAQISIGAVVRGSGTQTPGTFIAQSLRATFAWGSSPGEAAVVYIGAAPVSSGAEVTITIGGMFFAGICRTDTENRSTAGNTRTLVFDDRRKYLEFDYIACAFNKEEFSTVNGVRRKRYWHIYPANFNARIKNYTDIPLTAKEMILAIIGYTYLVGGTVGTLWGWDFTSGGQFPTGVLNVPVYDFDALTPKRLDAALNEISAATGTVFTLVSSPLNHYLLRWTRKGYGALPTFPADDADDIHSGVALSGNPTNIRVLGDRTRYQLMDVPLVKDWSPAWEQFFQVELLAEDIYQRSYTGTPGDPEQFIGRALAMERAMRITVREYVTLSGNNAFADYRKFAGRSRMDMPAALYIQSLLFRAFKPTATTLTNRSGAAIPMSSVDLVDQLLCKVTVNPTNGAMTFFPSEPASSNGLVITKGFQLSEEIFKQIKPEQFDINFFSSTSPSRLWQTTSFQLDDSGEGQRFILFDAPVFLCDNLMVRQNGHAVLNAGFTFTVPEVKGALVFEAENYSSWWGTYPNVSRDEVINVPSLRAEYVAQSGVFTEVLYADGLSANDKAYQIANAALSRQYLYYEGGRKRYWKPSEPSSSFAQPLTSMVDRVDIETSPRGTWLQVGLTNEKARDNFEPERDLERRTMQNTLFPGQQELIQQADAQAMLAKTYRQLPTDAFKLLQKFLRGEPLEGQTLKVGVRAGSGTLAAGTPLWRPTLAVAAQNTNTLAEMPGSVTSAHKQFCGVVLRQNEPANKPFVVATSGPTLARVLGPVTAGDSIGWVAGQSYLVKDGTPSVGKANQDISGATAQLIQVMLGVTSSQGNPFTITHIGSLVFSVSDGKIITTGAAFSPSNIAATHTLAGGVALYWVYLNITATAATVAVSATAQTWSVRKVPLGYVDTTTPTPIITPFVRDHIFIPCA